MLSCILAGISIYAYILQLCANTMTYEPLSVYVNPVINHRAGLVRATQAIQAQNFETSGVLKNGQNQPTQWGIQDDLYLHIV